MASIWSGHITFGLITIPVALHSALESSERVRFRMLHRKDMAPIQHRNFCSLEGVEVERDEIVRGYEVAKNQYALVEEEELQKVQEQVGEGDRAIEILKFVDLASLNPLLFEKPYYLVPQSGGERAYAVLRDALGETKRVGIARFYLRTKPLLAALLPGQKVLALAVLRAFEELRSPDALPLPEREVKAAEVKMARTLIDQLADRWDPTEHPNEYRRALEALLAEKRTTALREAPRGKGKGQAKVVDLMAALRKSLSASRERTARTRRPPARRRKTA
jgi:DNA end-binding protein Ku